MGIMGIQGSTVTDGPYGQGCQLRISVYHFFYEKCCKKFYRAFDKFLRFYPFFGTFCTILSQNTDQLKIPTNCKWSVYQPITGIPAALGVELAASCTPL